MILLTWSMKTTVNWWPLWSKWNFFMVLRRSHAMCTFSDSQVQIQYRVSRSQGCWTRTPIRPVTETRWTSSHRDPRNRHLKLGDDLCRRFEWVWGIYLRKKSQHLPEKMIWFAVRRTWCRCLRGAWSTWIHRPVEGLAFIQDLLVWTNSQPGPTFPIVQIVTKSAALKGVIVAAFATNLVWGVGPDPESLTIKIVGGNEMQHDTMTLSEIQYITFGRIEGIPSS